MSLFQFRVYGFDVVHQYGEPHPRVIVSRCCFRNLVALYLFFFAGQDNEVTFHASHFIGSMQASFNIGGRAYDLTAATEVGATVVAVDAGRVLVRMDADFSPSRRRSVTWAGVTGGLGVTSGAGVVALASLSAEPGALAIGAVVGSVWTALSGVAAAAMARAQRRKVARGQLALEQILDRLEHGDMRATRNPLMEFLNSVR